MRRLIRWLLGRPARATVVWDFTAAAERERTVAFIVESDRSMRVTGGQG